MIDNSILNDRYQLIEPRGKGGMAIVYRGKDLMLERTVAVKILRQSFSQSPAFRERFRQEAKAAANLSHPNIVTVYDFGWDKDYFFIVMEYIPGIDLKKWVHYHGRLSQKESLSLIIQACAGIGYAHRAGLVHCDIKPQNMLVTPDKRLMVTDFGIARALASIHPGEKLDIVWGSPQYISPEQAAGLAPSPASDVYSLGVVLYELLTAKLPFTSQNPTELVHLHREVIPTSPKSINPQISNELDTIIMKVLAKEPSARYRTADQLGRVLITITKDNTLVPSSPPKNPFTTRRIIPSASPIQSDDFAEKSTSAINIDWITILLGFISLLALGGLIPFWLWVYLRINPPFS
ncbi:MAG TPA: serine/threonine protein kinase [Anaerolineae bacterium]|nr:serine/threonine protein kinase [Anaerolineae bacterium]